MTGVNRSCREEVFMSKKNIILSAVPAVLSLLLSLGTLTVFRACAAKEDGTWMNCHNAQNAVVIAAAFLFIIFSVTMVIKIKAVRISLFLIGLAGSIVIFLIPGTIVSMCMMNTMQCYTLMQPFVRVMSAVIAVFSVIGIVTSLGQK